MLGFTVREKDEIYFLERRLMDCPNCLTPNLSPTGESPYCPSCGANLLTKKYKRSDDPGQLIKVVEEQNAKIKKLEDDAATIKRVLEERETDHAARDNRPKRTLFGN
jgi:uncharacterized Zn finger protein (UPF0148 family)